MAKIGSLSFFDPDEDLFPALKLARQALFAGGNAPATLNAANEIAVEAFLKEKIGFLEIATIVDKVLQVADVRELSDVGDVIEVDRWARDIARKLLT